MPTPSSTSTTPGTNNIETLNALPLETYRARLLGDETTLSSVLNDLSQPVTKDQPSPLQLSLSFTSSATLTSVEFEACFSLIKTSSMADYKNSSIRWSEAEKRREMRLPDLRYLLVRDGGAADSTAGSTRTDASDGRDADRIDDGKDASHQDGNRNPTTADDDNNYDDDSTQIQGFTSFMLTYEDGFEVVYIYEIHMADALRGKGVGARLMGLVEEVARRAGVAKTMLTVFVSNAGARRFYERLGYGLDDFSPRARKLRNGAAREPDYQILSKVVAGGGMGGRRKKKRPRLEESPS